MSTTKLGWPSETHTKILPRCRVCGEESERAFVVAEIAERWLVGHTSAWHPEHLDALTTRLVREGMIIDGRKPAPAPVTAPAASPTPQRAPRPSRKRRS